MSFSRKGTPCTLIYLIFRQVHTKSARHHRLLCGVETKPSLCGRIVHCLHPNFLTNTRVWGFHKLVQTLPVCMGPRVRRDIS
jgi:hypothetical protein